MSFVTLQFRLYIFVIFLYYSLNSWINYKLLLFDRLWILDNISYETKIWKYRIICHCCNAHKFNANHLLNHHCSWCVPHKSKSSIHNIFLISHKIISHESFQKTFFSIWCLCNHTKFLASVFFFLSKMICISNSPSFLKHCHKKLHTRISFFTNVAVIRNNEIHKTHTTRVRYLTHG